MNAAFRAGMEKAAKARMFNAARVAARAQRHRVIAQRAAVRTAERAEILTELGSMAGGGLLMGGLAYHQGKTMKARNGKPMTERQRRAFALSAGLTGMSIGNIVGAIASPLVAERVGNRFLARAMTRNARYAQNTIHKQTARRAQQAADIAAERAAYRAQQARSNAWHPYWERFNPQASQRIRGVAKIVNRSDPHSATGVVATRKLTELAGQHGFDMAMALKHAAQRT